MNDIDRSVLNAIADALPRLGLSDICELTIETNGATGGFDVIATGDDAEGDIVTRSLSFNSLGVEVTE